MKKCGAFIFLIFALMQSLSAQERGIYSVKGQGKGATREAAMEAAKLDAINTLVFSVLHRDQLFRDLFVSEALREGRLIKQETQKNPLGTWQAMVTIEIDEGLPEALYAGRYATTLINLLDQAEEEIPGIEKLLQDASQAESGGSLGSAETFYTQAQTTIDSMLRYLNPVEDAFYFSSQGKRKAPELKILLSSYKDTSQKGIDRVRKAQSQLNIAQSTQQLLSIYNQIEAALIPLEQGRDDLSRIASSLSSYTTDQLKTAEEQCRQIQSGLSLQKNQFVRASEGVSPSVLQNEQYILSRKNLLDLRLKDLDQQLSTLSRKFSWELFQRSTPVSALRWAINHEPAQYVAINFRLPWGLKPSDDGPVALSVPPSVGFSAEGSLTLNSASGLWGRSSIQAGSEYIIDPARLAAAGLANVRQELAIGFFRPSLLGLGLRWDWNREGQRPVTVIEAVWGIPGSSLGQRRPLPLWVNTLSWEIPGETKHVLSYINGGLDSVLRPNSYIGFSLSLASRVRSDAVYDRPSWIGSAGLGFNFRLPVLRPLQWRIGWEGYISSPLTDMGLRSDEFTGNHGFTWGLSYVF